MEILDSRDPRVQRERLVILVSLESRVSVVSQELKDHQDLPEKTVQTVSTERMELPVWTVAMVPTEKKEILAPVDHPEIRASQE